MSVRAERGSVRFRWMLRLLPSARRFRDLGAAPPDEIPQIEPVQTAPRVLQAPELRTLLDVVDAAVEDEAFSVPSGQGSRDEW